MRVGDGSANPYLAIAAILAAGADGIRARADPAARRSTGDAYRADARRGRRAAARARSTTRSTRSRPTTLLTRRDRPRDRRARSSPMKRFEIDRHRAWVSDWEIDEYLHHL